MRRDLALILVSLILTAPLAFAQEEQVGVEDIFSLYREGTLTTATKTDRLVRTAPQAVTVITREQIEQSGATSLSEVLRFVPGINARMTPMGSQMGIRSFGPTPFSERVLFLIDGTPYNSPDKGGYPGHPAYEDFFPLEAIKRIEVIKGPGSSLYGYNAFFGVINIITDNFIVGGKGTNNLIAKGGSRSSGTGVARGGTVNDSGDWKFTYLGKYKTQVGPMIFLEDPSKTPGLPNLQLSTPTGIIPLNTDGTDVKNGDVYIKSQFKDLLLSYLFHRDETDSYSWIKPRLLAGGPPAVPFPGFDTAVGCCNTVSTEQTLQFFDATFNKQFDDQNRFQAKAFYNRRNGNTCGNCHALGGAGGTANILLLEREDETNQRFFVNAQYDWIISSHKIIFGADFQFDKTDKNIGKLDGPFGIGIPTDDSINTQAAYVQDEIRLAPDKVILTLGIRLDHNEITDNAVSPSVSAVFLPTENMVLRFLYGRAHRQPTWNDLFARTSYIPANLFPTRQTVVGDPVQLQYYEQNGNPNADTEQIDTIEAGLEYDFTKSVSVKFDAFWSRAKDLIEAYDFEDCNPANPNRPVQCDAGVRNGVTNGFLAVTQNVDRNLDSNGFEIEARFDPSPAFSAIVGYAYQNNDFELLNPPFPVIGTARSRTFLDAYSPENKFTAMVNVRPFEPLLFNLSLNYWSSYNTRFFPADATCAACTNTDEIGQPYTYANFNTFYTFPMGNQKLTFGLTVKNLFDEEVQLSHAFRVDSAMTGREYFGMFRFDF
jgi:outer membrane receptor protein involved in Fe transport